MERGLLREHEYDAERAERARAGGITVAARACCKAGWPALGVAAVGGGLATSPGALGTAAPSPPTPRSSSRCRRSLFIPRGTNAEMRWEAMRGPGLRHARSTGSSSATTPPLRGSTPRPGACASHGTGVAPRAVIVATTTCCALPQVTVTRAIECAGNGRSFFDTQQGTPAAGTAWGLGAIGVATWTGVPLSEVLDRAGLTSPAPST